MQKAKKYVMALDQGTTSSRCILFDRSGKVCSVAQKEFAQYYPQPGWVEHNPMEIWSSQLSVAVEAMGQIGAEADDIAAIGITNQRETTICFSKKTGKPVYPAIVWQCRRTADKIDALKKDGFDKVIRERTGLIPDAYFSATKICCNFPETIEHLPAGKAVLTGSPIRQELLSGDKYKALEFLHFTQDKPVIMVVGGSLGSVAVNDAVRSVLPELLQSFQVVHLCGKGKVDESLKDLQGYAQFEYIKDELKDLFALTDLVISRAGANAICELLALHKPNLLIPLSANASRGDQILNARSFERQGYSVVLEEEELNHDVLLDAIMNLYQNRETYIQAMKNSPQQNSIDTIIDLIEAAARH